MKPNTNAPFMAQMGTLAGMNTNGQIVQAGGGSLTIAQQLSANGMQVNGLRPYWDTAKDGVVRPYITVNGPNGPTPQLHGNATLRRDEWKLFDDVLLATARRSFVGIADLESRGLTYGSGIGLGALTLEYEDIGELEPANISMDAIRRGRKDRPEFSQKQLPLPIYHYDWGLNARFLEAARRAGNPVQTTTMELGTFQISVLAEDVLFNGTSNYNYGGGTIYGYTTFPQRITHVITDWSDTDNVTGEEILQDVLTMIQLAAAKNKRGPFLLYIPQTFEKRLDEDYKADTNVTLTLRERLMKLSKLEDIKISDSLADGNVTMVEMQSTTVRLITPLELTNVEWTEKGGMEHEFKTMMIKVPHLRADQKGQCGIVHGAVAG